MKILLVSTIPQYPNHPSPLLKPCISQTVLLGCTHTRPLPSQKYLIVFASGSSSTAPEILAANFFSGNSIRAICGLKAPAMRARRRAGEELLLSNVEVGSRNPISLREERYCERLAEMSMRVWWERKCCSHQARRSRCVEVWRREDHSSKALRSARRSPFPLENDARAALDSSRLSIGEKNGLFTVRIAAIVRQA